MALSVNAARLPAALVARVDKATVADCEKELLAGKTSERTWSCGRGTESPRKTRSDQKVFVPTVLRLGSRAETFQAVSSLSNVTPEPAPQETSEVDTRLPKPCENARKGMRGVADSSGLSRIATTQGSSRR